MGRRTQIRMDTDITYMCIYPSTHRYIHGMDIDIHTAKHPDLHRAGPWHAQVYICKQVY